jgi:hypothetical protein
LHGSRPGVAEGCGQCCGTRQRCKSTAARAGGEPAISSGSETLSAAATRWQERAKMTDASENTPHWTAGGPPRTVPSSLSPGAARRAVGPSRAGRPARAPARSSWHGGVRRATGRAWLAARAGGAPLPRYSSLRSAPIQQLRSAHRRAAGTPARERSAPASCWRRAAHEERDRTRRRPPPPVTPPTWPSPRRPRMY